MLNISFLACAKVELWDLKVCIVVNGEKFQSCHDLDLGPTMPNINLVIFIYYNVFKFHVPRSISFRVILQKHTHKGTHTHTYGRTTRL